MADKGAHDFTWNTCQEDLVIESLTDTFKDGNDHTNTLGSVRLQDAITKARILVPAPSNDPNDPLNW